jgi:hypothetical protein
VIFIRLSLDFLLVFRHFLEKKNEKVQQTKFAITMHGKSYLLFNGGNKFFCENIQ